MSFAVCHIERCNPNTFALGKHIDRSQVPENADPKKVHLNRILVNHGSNIMQAIDDRVKAGYTGKTAIRKDAVKAFTVVLTGTHEPMKELEKNGRLDNWVDYNRQWLEHRYGKENIVSLALHLDEKTPHLHAVIVPLTSDGRLTAREILGNKEKMKQMQTEYANAMNGFGLERGKEGSRARHEDVKEYYKRVNVELPEVTQKIELANKALGDLGLKNDSKHFLGGITGKNDLKAKNEALLGQNLELSKQVQIANEKIVELKQNVELYKKENIDAGAEYAKEIAIKEAEILRLKEEKERAALKANKAFRMVNKFNEENGIDHRFLWQGDKACKATASEYAKILEADKAKKEQPINTIKAPSVEDIRGEDKGREMSR